MTPEQYLAWQEENREFHLNMRAKMLILENEPLCPVPTNLRPATPKDLVVGNVLWYPPEQNPGYCEVSERWHVIEEVLSAQGIWKNYCAHDGCRYGLDGAFVEVPQEEEDCDSALPQETLEKLGLFDVY